MRIQRITSALLLALIVPICLHGQGTTADTPPRQGAAGFVGIWQGELDGQPSVIVTLADDDGLLQGTIELNGISREGGSPHVAVHEVHELAGRKS